MTTNTGGVNFWNAPINPDLVAIDLGHDAHCGGDRAAAAAIIAGVSLVAPEAQPIVDLHDSGHPYVTVPLTTDQVLALYQVALPQGCYVREHWSICGDLCRFSR